MFYNLVYGDATFPSLHCIAGHHRRPWRGALKEFEDEEKTDMNHIEVTAEWPYETLTNLFHIVHSRCHKMLLQHNLDSHLVKTASCPFVFYITVMFV
jgi:hypothetical protein